MHNILVFHEPPDDKQVLDVKRGRGAAAQVRHSKIVPTRSRALRKTIRTLYDSIGCNSMNYHREGLAYRGNLDNHSLPYL